MNKKNDVFYLLSCYFDGAKLKESISLWTTKEKAIKEALSIGLSDYRDFTIRKIVLNKKVDPLQALYHTKEIRVTENSQDV